MNTIQKIIKQAIDIHVHIGPEIIPRKYTVSELIKAETGKIGGMVLKNHFYATTGFIKGVKSKKNLKLFGSIVLNNSVGGLNKEVILATSYISNDPFFVWFPTINAGNFLKKSEYEIAPEWVNKNNFRARKASKTTPVILTRKKVLAVLKTIKECNAILATGHISWQETIMLVDEALQIGIKQIVITHPIYQQINMPTDIQIVLAKKGCFIEQCYSMYSIDKIPIKKIAQQIKAVGSKSIILSSDVGQTFSLSPSRALRKFGELLLKEGISYKELYQMIVINPKKLLSV